MDKSIQAILNTIESTISRKIDYQNAQSVQSKLNDCLNLLGESAKIKAIAYGNLEKAKAALIQNYPDQNARMLKILIDSQTVDEQEQYILADRLHISLFKAIDGLKSMMAVQEKQVEVRWE